MHGAVEFGIDEQRERQITKECRAAWDGLLRRPEGCGPEDVVRMILYHPGWSDTERIFMAFHSGRYYARLEG